MKKTLLTLVIALYSIITYAQIPSSSGDVRLSDIYEDDRASVFDGGTIVITGTLYIDTSLYLHSTNIQATRVVIGNPNRYMFVHITAGASITATETHMPYDNVYLFNVNTSAGASYETTTLTGGYPDYVITQRMQRNN